MTGSGGSASLWGKRKPLHIVLAVITFGLWLLGLFALYLWRKGRKCWSIATASALALIALVIGIGVAAVTETTTEAAEPADYPGLTATFDSPINGYSFKYIDRGGLAPAKKVWDPVNQPPLTHGEFNWSSASHNDQFDVVETGLSAVFKSASTEIHGWGLDR